MRSLAAARFLLLVLAAGIVPACIRSSRTPTTDPVLFVGAGSLNLRSVALSGRQEVPVNASVATGNALVQLDESHMWLKVTVNFSGLTDLTEAHIHVGVPGVDGPIIFALAEGPFTSPLEVLLIADNTIPATLEGVSTWTDAINALARGQCYVNLHTAAFPGGEIRGQIGPVTLQATLSGDQVVPPVVSPSTGTMTLQMNNEQTFIDFELNISNASNVTFAHIHAGPPGVNGEILFTLAFTPDPTRLGGTLSTANFAPSIPGTTFDSMIDALISGLTYVDVHTLNFPDGEIRGLIQGTVISVPVPVTVVPVIPPTNPTVITPPSPIFVGPY